MLNGMYCAKNDDRNIVTLTPESFVGGNPNESRCIQYTAITAIAPIKLIEPAPIKSSSIFNTKK